MPPGSRTCQKTSADVFMTSFDNVTHSTTVATQTLEHVSNTSSDDISNIATQIHDMNQNRPRNLDPTRFTLIAALLLTVDFDFIG